MNRSRLQAFVYDVLALLLIGGALFAGIEAIVRALALDDLEKFGGSSLRYQQIFPPLFQSTETKDVYRPRDPRLVDRAIPRPTNRDELRLFIFGESAVAGLGMSENGSFPRALERRLHGALRSDRDGLKPSVVNVGIVALSSRQVLAAVRDVQRLISKESQPNGRTLFLFHVGNNEFLELHAKKFIESSGGTNWMFSLRSWMNAHIGIYRALEALSLQHRYRNLSMRDFSTSDLRLTEGELIKKVTLSEQEISSVVSAHAENLKKMIETARAGNITPVLMTVATNIEWAGREDKFDEWYRQIVESELRLTPGERMAQLNEAMIKLSQLPVENGRPNLEAWKLLFVRAGIRLRLGDFSGARADYEAAKNVDPHLRRCLSQMNQNVRILARETNTILVDAEKFLAEKSKNEITGFEMLYDYVHFTPMGSELIAEAIEGSLVDAGILLTRAQPSWTNDRKLELANSPHDSLSVQEWLGWNSDRAMLGSRDLWKYEAARAALDKKIKLNSATAQELIWAANGYSLEVGGEPEARRLLNAARGHSFDQQIEENLLWLSHRSGDRQ